MAKIKPKTLKFNPPTSPDAVAANIRIVPTGTGADYAQAPQGQITDLSAQGDGKIHVDLAGLDAQQTLDGVYDIAVTYVDEVGNESAFGVVVGVGLDFIAPDAPTGIEVV